MQVFVKTGGSDTVIANITPQERFDNVKNNKCDDNVSKHDMILTYGWKHLRKKHMSTDYGTKSTPTIYSKQRRQ